MPKLWNDTVEEHREAVKQATIAATAALIGEHGLSDVTMAQIAKNAGIGRSTLYKYYPDVDAILADWHKREVGAHLNQIERMVGEAPDPASALRLTIRSYALNLHRGHGSAIAAALHHGPHADAAKHHLVNLTASTIAEGTKRGLLRNDVPAWELAAFCVHACEAARHLPSKEAVTRLAELILQVLKPAKP